MPLSASFSCLSPFSSILFGHANAFATLLVCMKVQLFLMLLFLISGSSLFLVLPRLQHANTLPLLGQETSSRVAENSWLFYLNAVSGIKDNTVEWRRTHVHAILFVPSHLCPRSKVHILIIWYPASLISLSMRDVAIAYLKSTFAPWLVSVRALGEPPSLLDCLIQFTDACYAAHSICCGDRCGSKALLNLPEQCIGIAFWVSW